ncbi:hypothetical protein HOO65_090185 [Ceratocystis lukuohia]|uniref:Uncharacterized protein n=1 Tax=Ceratocystis lukuohia TaxID=2019550 RepID=A0ABR4M9E1_9PEZI
MKASLSFLALSLLSLSLASGIEDHGYNLKIKDHLYSVFSPHYGNGAACLDAIHFNDYSKVASIFVAKNDQEPEHDNKLSLAEVYTALCEKEGMTANDMHWLTFSVDHGSNTNRIIGLIRQGRKWKNIQEVELLPGDRDWDSIVGTDHYKMMRQLINKPVKKIILKKFYQHDYLGSRSYTEGIHFSF